MPTSCPISGRMSAHDPPPPAFRSRTAVVEAPPTALWLRSAGSGVLAQVRGPRRAPPHAHRTHLRVPAHRAGRVCGHREVCAGTGGVRRTTGPTGPIGRDHRFGTSRRTTDASRSPSGDQRPHRARSPVQDGTPDQRRLRVPNRRSPARHGGARHDQAKKGSHLRERPAGPAPHGTTIRRERLAARVFSPRAARRSCPLLRLGTWMSPAAHHGRAAGRRAATPARTGGGSALPSGR
jgi:hypothetical protein